MNIDILTNKILERLWLEDKQFIISSLIRTAVPQDKIDKILEIIHEKELTILGGDVLKLKNNDFIHTYDNWYSNINKNESNEEYRIRSYKETKDFLNDYIFDNDIYILFVVR